MGSARTSMRFVVGTALLTTAGAAGAEGCNNRTYVNTRPEEPTYVNTGPMQPDRPVEEPPGATTGEEVSPGQGPIVNTVAAPDAAPEPSPRPPSDTVAPAEKEPPTVNVRSVDDEAPKTKPKTKVRNADGG